MHLANGFKLIYERVKDATRKLYASKTSLPEEEDAELDFGVPAEELQNIKLVYEKDGKIMISKTGIPSEDDIATTITADGEVVISDEDEPVPPGPVPGYDKFKVGEYVFGAKLNVSKDTTELDELLLNYQSESAFDAVIMAADPSGDDELSAAMYIAKSFGDEAA